MYLEISSGKFNVEVPQEQVLDIIRALTDKDNVTEDGKVKIELTFGDFEGSPMEPKWFPGTDKGVPVELYEEEQVPVNPKPAQPSDKELREQWESKQDNNLRDEKHLTNKLEGLFSGKFDTEDTAPSKQAKGFITELEEISEQSTEEERKPSSGFGNFVDENPEETRSIHDLTDKEEEDIVFQYINGVPTKSIIDNNNITKSALYSSLEHKQIPRKQTLNTIIRGIDEEDTLEEIAEDTDTPLEVVEYINEQYAQ